MDAELRFIRAVSRILPPLPHVTAIINRLLKPIYLRKKREQVTCVNHDVLIELDPHEAVDASLLFQPEFYDRSEIIFLKSNLKEGDIFVDVGANIGIYGLIAAHKIVLM